MDGGAGNGATVRIPKHPISERGAFWFHLGFALIGAAHVVGGIAMSWFHLTGAKRHYDDIGRDR